MIHLIYAQATPEEVREMLEIFGDYIKVAVDVERNILAGGGRLHADCEAVMLESGSEQANLWGADWYPYTQELRYEALMNIRPLLGNRSMIIKDPALRDKMAVVVSNLLRGVQP